LHAGCSLGHVAVNQNGILGASGIGIDPVLKYIFLVKLSKIMFQWNLTP
jgi:hypothetical protein